MLTDRVSNMKCLQEHTEDALDWSDEHVREWFIVQIYAGEGIWATDSW